MRSPALCAWIKFESIRYSVPMPDTDVAGPALRTNDAPVAALRVLASGSAGNCSVLMLRDGDRRRVCLIDLGLSPRRTSRELQNAGLSLDDVEHVFITHFDTDHFNRSWASVLRDRATYHVHESHVGEARSLGVRTAWIDAVRDETMVGEARVFTTLLAHDAEGVAAFRFEHAGAVAGFATDVGKPTGALIDCLGGSDLLAVESNYCPELQAASNRPAFLKSRIMGGRGHLSNQQCAALVRRAQPRQDVVLLHLSRQCNRPELAAREHAEAPYRLTISAQHEATPWVAVAPSGAPSIMDQAGRVNVRSAQSPLLFSPD